MGERTDMRLLVLIARSEAAFDPLVTGLLDVGISGATVVESRGLAAVLRQDLPIFAGLAAFLPQTTGSRVVISLCGADRLEALRAYVAELPPSDRPLAIALPVDSFFGLEPTS